MVTQIPTEITQTEYQQSDTVDWLGETIRSFNETKIVKIGSSGQGQNNSACMQFALGEDGSVWLWGHNNQSSVWWW